MVSKIGTSYYGITKPVTVGSQQVRDAVEDAFRFAKALPAEKVRADLAAKAKAKTAPVAGSKP